MPEAEIQEFARLFNGGHFFQAHEVLEKSWREETGERRDFYQGLIQVAAALVHVQKGNRYGAVSLAAKSTAYLKKYPAVYCGVSVTVLLQELNKFLDGTSADYPRIPI